MTDSNVIQLQRLWDESPTRETFDQHPGMRKHLAFFLGMLLLEANRKGDGWDAGEVADVLRFMDADITDAREADLGMAIALDLELLTPAPHPTEPERSVWIPTAEAWQIRDESARKCREAIERNGGTYVEDDEYLGPPSPTPEEFREVSS